MSSPHNVHLVINRRARHLESEGSRLLAELRRPRADGQIFETHSLDDLDIAATEIAMETARRAEAVVVLAGGDGSYMAGVGALARAFGRFGLPLPSIALAPGGTVCTVARNWGFVGDPVVHANALLDALSSSKGSTRSRTVRRPTLRVRATSIFATETSASAEMEERIGFIFGAGLVARFFTLYEAGGAKGNAAAAKIVARVFAGSFVGSKYARSVLDPDPCEIVVDGSPAAFDRVSLLCASVVRDLGLHMHLLYRAAEEEERFHVVATPLGPRALGPQLPLVLAGRPLIGPRVDALAGDLTLRFPTGGAYVLDGDLFNADEIHVSAGPVLDIVDVGAGAGAGAGPGSRVL